MDERLGGLTEREKETLRLLLVGHDAKSVAGALGLSVHTVNERLREARRMLGVTSSREAARLLARHEGAGPKILGDTEMGVAAAGDGLEHQPSHQRRRSGGPVAWLIGGMVIMLAILAAAYLATTLVADRGAPAATPAARPAPDAASDKAGADAARAWAELLDERRWGESWTQSGGMFRSALTQKGWAATIEPLRRQLGSVSSRSLRSVSNATSLPGAPDGDYKIVQFTTDFANLRGATETVVLAREGSAWKVTGYFIR